MKFLNYPIDKTKSHILNTTQDLQQAVKNQLINIVKTNFGQRFFDVQFGLNLRKYLFQQDLQVADNRFSIKQRIKSKIMKYVMQIVQILDVDVITDSDKNKLDFVVRYKFIPNKKQKILQIYDI